MTRPRPKNYPTMEEVREFLTHSNYIEGVYGDDAYKDAKKAWDYMLKQDHVTDKEILWAHKILMRNLNPNIAGKFRDCDVWIGGEHKKFIDPDVLLYQVRNALTTVLMSFNLKGDKEQMARHSHVLFENVHPFEDGNGRIGRLLYNWHRLKLGLPIHIIHEGDEQMEYYRWFKKDK